MITIREKFNKSERLCSRKTITGLFESGNTLYTSHFRVLWTKTDQHSPFPARAAFFVPKKIFRHAVTRNLLRRRMKEAYRKNKNILYELLRQENIRIVFIVIYKIDNTEEYSPLEEKMKELLYKLRADLRKRTSN